MTAFGFALDISEPVPGLDGGPPDAGAPVLRVEIVRSGTVEPTIGPVLLSHTAPDGRLDAALSRDAGGRYRMFAAGPGSFDLDPGAATITCRPAPGHDPWLWQQFLMNQALPLAAALHGIEPFHASGVVLDGRVVAVAGASGGGKSSLALTLATRGHGFHTDDVLAIGPGVMCKPGPGAANVRDPRLQELARAGAPPFRSVLGNTSDGIRVLVERDERERPLGAVYFVDHAPEQREIAAEPTRDVRFLLGHTFNVLARAGERQAAQLEMCASIVEGAPLFRLHVPPETPVAALAAYVEEHARTSNSHFFAT